MEEPLNARVLFGLLVVLLGSIACNILLLIDCAVWWSVNTRIYRRIASKCEALWIDCMAFALPSTTLHLSGEIPDAIDHRLKYNDKKPLIIISNHMVDADWYYLWMFARTVGCHGLVKIILKDSVKNMPIFGWGMHFFEFIFLAREWERDKSALFQVLRSFVADKYPVHLVIFPEGTTINQETVAKCKNFARETGREEFNLVMTPRVRGLKACMEALKGAKPDILDVTITYHSYTGEVPTWDMGYSRNIDKDVPNLVSMLKGRGCSNVHMHLERIPYEEAAKDVEGNFDDVTTLATYDGSTLTFVTSVTGAWFCYKKFLDRQWAKKENLLAQFIKQGHFSDKKPRELPVSAGPWPFAICMAVLLVGAGVTTRMFFYYPLQCSVLMGTYAFVRFNARRLNWDYGPSR